MAIFNRTVFDQAGELYGLRGASKPQTDEIASHVEVIQYTPAERITSAIVAKRFFDVVVASLAMFILSPFIIAVALAVKLDSRGPVFFAQERIGLNRRREKGRSPQPHASMNARSGFDRRKSINAGRPFKIYKFRTMVRDAEGSGPVLARENDPRVTRIGRLLRNMRIDEIPQFINVIKGDMSIIGPRPERSFFINQVKREVPEFTMRLVVKPGITGLAQVEKGYTKTIDEMKGKLFYDLKYIADLSLMQEIKILLKTAYVIVMGKGAC